MVAEFFAYFFAAQKSMANHRRGGTKIKFFKEKDFLRRGYIKEECSTIGDTLFLKIAFYRFS